METAEKPLGLAFAYLRVSGKGQIEGDGFTRQLTAIQAYAKAQGVKIIDVYQEKGVTGTVDGMDRPAWVEMIERIMASGGEGIVIERLDRLARDLMIQEHILKDLKRRGIKIVSVAEPDLCTDDPTRKLLRQIMGAIAEYDKTMIVLKLRGARQRKRANGERCEGAKRYGEKPGERLVLKRIATARAAGEGLQKIAQTLNDEGIKPRRGEKWHASSVRSVLMNA
jgi:DNA invertase Pin-like site-specific DNA recombinase